MKYLKIFLLVFLLKTSYLISQEVYRNNNNNFEITIPADWKQIPQTQLDKFNEIANSRFGDIKATKYIVAFQKKLSNKYFSNPYCIIDIKKSGKLSENDIRKSSKSLKDEFGKEIGKVKEKLRKYLQNAEANESYYDEENTRIISSFEMKANNTTTNGLIVMKLTSYGTINMYFYSTSNTWEKYYPEFLEFADNLKVDSKYEYVINKEKETKTTQTKDSTNKKENRSAALNFIYDILYPIINYIIFISPLIIFFLLLKKYKKEYPEFVNHIKIYKWIISVILCLILFLLQFLITKYLTIPLILNVLSIYPLVLFISHIVKDKQESTMDISSNRSDSLELNKEITDNQTEITDKSELIESTSNTSNSKKEDENPISDNKQTENSNLLESQEQLEFYAKTNWKYFKGICSKYEQSNPEYYITIVKPVMEKYAYLDEIVNKRDNKQVDKGKNTDKGVAIVISAFLLFIMLIISTSMKLKGGLVYAFIAFITYLIYKAIAKPSE